MKMTIFSLLLAACVWGLAVLWGVASERPKDGHVLTVNRHRFDKQLKYHGLKGHVSVVYLHGDKAFFYRNGKHHFFDHNVYE